MSYERDDAHQNSVTYPSETASKTNVFLLDEMAVQGVISKTEDQGQVPLPAVAGITFSVAALVILSVQFLSLLWPEALLESASFQLALNMINQIGVFVMIPLLILVLTKHKIKNVLRLNKPKMSEVIFSAALPITLFPVGIALVTIVMLLIEIVFGSSADLTGIESMMSETNIFVMILFIAVMPSICEEVLFRGVVLRGLQKNGIVLGIVLTAILFGLFHMDFQRFIAQALMGAVAGVVVYRTNSLFCGMIVHFMNNFIALLLSFMAMSFTTSQEGEEVSALGTLEALRASAESANVDVVFMAIQMIIILLIVIIVFAGLTLPLMIGLFCVTKKKTQCLCMEREVNAEIKRINPAHYLAFVPGLLVIGYTYYLTALYLWKLA